MPEHWRSLPAALLAGSFPLVAYLGSVLTVALFIPLMLAAIVLNRPALDRPLFAAVGLLAVWAGLSGAWAPESGEALAKFARAAGFAFVALAALPALSARSALTALRIGAGAAVFVLAVECVAGWPVYAMLRGVPSNGPDALAPFANRCITALAFAVWGIALATGRRWAVHLMPLALAAFCLFFENLSAIVALIAGTAAAGLASVHRQLGRVVLAAACAGALFGGPLLALSGVLPKERVSATLESRLLIWELVNELIAEKPVAGWGFTAARQLPITFTRTLDDGTSHTHYPLHPHNFGAEILMELGLIGLIPAIAILFLVVRRIDRLERETERIAATGLAVTILSAGSTAYGLSQSHTLAMILFGIMAFGMALRTGPGDPRPAPG